MGIFFHQISGLPTLFNEVAEARFHWTLNFIIYFLKHKTIYLSISPVLKVIELENNGKLPRPCRIHIRY